MFLVFWRRGIREQNPVLLPHLSRLFSFFFLLIKMFIRGYEPNSLSYCLVHLNCLHILAAREDILPVSIHMPPPPFELDKRIVTIAFMRVQWDSSKAYPFSHPTCHQIRKRLYLFQNTPSREKQTDDSTIKRLVSKFLPGWLLQRHDRRY
jgi:hypothetical protein